MINSTASCAWGRPGPSRSRTQGAKCARSGTRASRGRRDAKGLDGIQACEVVGLLISGPTMLSGFRKRLVSDQRYEAAGPDHPFGDLLRPTGEDGEGVDPR